MASKTKAALQQDKVPEKEGPETPPDSPLLDLSDATVKMLIRTAKKRGYITHDQINLLSKEVNSEQIEDVLAMFSEMGVNVVETEEASEEEGGEREEPEEEEAEAESGELVEVQQKVPAKSETKEPTEERLGLCVLHYLNFDDQEHVRLRKNALEKQEAHEEIKSVGKKYLLAARYGAEA